MRLRARHLGGLLVLVLGIGWGLRAEEPRSSQVRQLSEFGEVTAKQLAVVSRPVARSDVLPSLQSEFGDKQLTEDSETVDLRFVRKCEMFRGLASWLLVGLGFGTGLLAV